MRCLVVCLNPALDIAWEVDQLRWEEKNPVRKVTRWAGGKGVNVARWINRLGGNCTLLVPLGGHAGRELKLLLRMEGIRAQVVPLRNSTRQNVVVTSASGRQIRFNQPGPCIFSGEQQRVWQEYERRLKRVSVVVLSGSIPPGFPRTIYSRMIRLAKVRGLKVLVDCDGAAFASAVRSKPFLVKPNVYELREWSRQSLRGSGDLVQQALRLANVTGGWVAVSRGSRGALLTNAEGCRVEVAPPEIKVRNSVGAGDALLAVLALRTCLAQDVAGSVAFAVATGTAVAATPPGKQPSLTCIRRILGQVRIKRFGPVPP